MSEPKFSDAACYGKEFDANSRICNVCIANKSCQRKFFRQLGMAKPQGPSVLDSVSRRKVQAQPAFP